MEKDKSICFITTGDIKSIATAKRALGLANHLSDLGWKVSIIMDDTEENRHRAALECDKRTEIFYMCYRSAFDELRKKNNLLKQIKPDVIYICAFVFRNIVFNKHSCIRLVEHPEMQSAINGISSLKRLRYLMIEYFSIVYSTALLNASMYLQKHFRRLATKLCRKKLPLFYFPYAYNGDVCKNVNENNLFVKTDGDGKYFVYLGSLTKNYGAFTMLKAFEIIHTEYPNYHLLLLGKGRDYQNVIDYIKKNNTQSYVHALGYVEEEDIATYFTLADAFISPMNDTVQDWARCPSKLYMYLPYKKAIITCKIGEPYEVLKEKGIYFEPSSAESLANAIRELSNKKSWDIDINPLQHEWKQRASDFDDWMKRTFYKTM